MTVRSSLTVVLAAGEGTRMRSALPKVLHQVASQSLLAHVLDAAPHGAGAALAVVVGPNHKAVVDEVARVRPDAATFVRPSGSGPRMRCWRRARRSLTAPTISWWRSAIRR